MLENKCRNAQNKIAMLGKTLRDTKDVNINQRIDHKRYPRRDSMKKNGDTTKKKYESKRLFDWCLIDSKRLDRRWRDKTARLAGKTWPRIYSCNCYRMLWETHLSSSGFGITVVADNDYSIR